MTVLSEVQAGKQGRVLSVGGTVDFQRRITAVGVTPGSSFSVIQNEKKYPVLLDIRSTLLAVDREDCGNIMVEIRDEVSLTHGAYTMRSETKSSLGRTQQHKCCCVLPKHRRRFTV